MFVSKLAATQGYVARSVGQYWKGDLGPGALPCSMVARGSIAFPPSS